MLEMFNASQLFRVIEQTPSRLLHIPLTRTNNCQTMLTCIHTDDRVQALLDVLSNHNDQFIDARIVLLAHGCPVGFWAGVDIMPDHVDAVDIEVVAIRDVETRKVD